MRGYEEKQNNLVPRVLSESTLGTRLHTKITWKEWKGFARPYCRENRYSQVLRSIVALNSYLVFSALLKFYFLLYV